MMFWHYNEIPPSPTQYLIAYMHHGSTTPIMQVDTWTESGWIIERMYNPNDPYDSPRVVYAWATLPDYPPIQPPARTMPGS